MSREQGAESSLSAARQNRAFGRLGAVFVLKTALGPGGGGDVRYSTQVQSCLRRRGLGV